MLGTVACDGLETLYLVAQYLNRLGSSDRNAGEASVLAWAEANGAVAYVDDEAGCNTGRQRGVEVKRTLSLVVAGYRRGVFTEVRAQELIERLADYGARLPREAVQDLFGWARAQGLLA